MGEGDELLRNSDDKEIIACDLLLLENQLPMVVLDHVFGVCLGSVGWDGMGMPKADKKCIDRSDKHRYLPPVLFGPDCCHVHYSAQHSCHYMSGCLAYYLPRYSSWVVQSMVSEYVGLSLYYGLSLNKISKNKRNQDGAAGLEVEKFCQKLIELNLL
ncbi:hypothetical protein Syun_029939 [Stephania yunnanensis]|uniref:Uncharacterized protein n=1 Tax=Stephania yunnanensis TaxID=152371 RepID=A0AAP0E8W3_9MAGN